MSLRIFYAAGARPNSSLAESRIWFYNLFMPLRDLGHDVVPFEYDLEPHYANADPSVPSKRDFIAARRPALEEQLLRQIEAAHRKDRIDLFFSYFYSSFATPEVIREIRRMGIITVNWYCNASYQFHLVSEIAPAYDFCLVPEKFRLDDYRRIGANPIYCQEAANANVYKPHALAREFPVTFVGAQYADRAEYVRHLLDGGIDVRVWGLGWKALCPPESALRRVRWWAGRAKRKWLRQPCPAVTLPGSACGAPLTDDEMIRMYSRSQISLGFSVVGASHASPGPIRQIRLRDFEAPMSGAFYMTEYMEEIEEFFLPGKEIVCYHDKEDLVEKVGYYLSHDNEREEIRRAGHRRATNQHTWQRRFQMAFQEMGMP